VANQERRRGMAATDWAVGTLWIGGGAGCGSHGFGVGGGGASLGGRRGSGESGDVAMVLNGG
jgi:hypothetical protein